jgi:hypothetical protein
MAGTWKRLHAKIIAAGKTPCPAAYKMGKDIVHCQGIENHKGMHRRGDFQWVTRTELVEHWSQELQKACGLTDEETAALIKQAEKEKLWE